MQAGSAQGGGDCWAQLTAACARCCIFSILASWRRARSSFLALSFASFARLRLCLSLPAGWESSWASSASGSCCAARRSNSSALIGPSPETLRCRLARWNSCL